MNIRIATPKDARSISSLVIETASAHIRDEFTDEGWQLFLQLFSHKAQKELLKSEEFFYLLAEEETNSDDKSKIIGMLAIREQSHIFHFFIRSKSQNKGVGRQLWQYYLQKIKSEELTDNKFDKITVNASDFGIQFYLKLGFVKNGPRQMKNGVYFNPLFFSL